MKASIAAKIDLGWVFSTALAISLVLMLIARASLTLNIQAKADLFCEQEAYELVETFRLVGDGRAQNGVSYYTGKCKIEYKKSLTEVFLDMNAWSYEEVYKEKQ